MKFSIGYQLPDEYTSFPEICREYGEKISDVFFSWGNEPSGRFPLGTEKELPSIIECQTAELSEIKRLGKKLTLLLNANCYGEAAASEEFGKRIVSLASELYDKLSIDAVTTASPFIAEILKREFGNTLKIKASVNMRIGSVKAMRQLGDFDGFYVKKELNRSLHAIAELKNWCQDNGKELYMLANSGCITDCAYQTFHDNMIAHQTLDDAKHGTGTGYSAPCHKLLKSFGLIGGVSEFMGAGWIRPEEIHLYEPYFDEIKLATRMHSRPEMIIAAYCRGRFRGNLLDLTEPSFSSLFRGYVLDNTLISNDAALKLFNCDHRCDRCGTCENIVRSALVRMN